ncbi:MAG: cytochrome C oxidase subunit IV family protein [Chloroflexota bacterium]
MTLAEYRKKRSEPVLPEEEAHSEHHPAALEYLQIGAILTVITAVEVGIYYIDMSHTLLVGMLIILSLVKFTMVVAWFMHLKFDSRLFTIAFVTGLATALTVFTVVIAAMRGGLV